MGTWPGWQPCHRHACQGSHGFPQPRTPLSYQVRHSFPLCKSQSREELFICQCLHQGKEKFRLRQARSHHKMPLWPGLELVQPAHPPANSDLWAKPQRLEWQRAVWGGMEHILVCLLPGCSLAGMKNKPMSCHPPSSSSTSSWMWGWGLSGTRLSSRRAATPTQCKHKSLRTSLALGQHNCSTQLPPSPS